MQYISQNQFSLLYKEVDLIGRGSFSVVKRVKRLSDGQMFAAKCIWKANLNFAADDVLHEYGLHLRLRHPNVVRMVEALETDENVYLIMQLADGGNILEWFSRMPTYSESDVRERVRELLHVLAALHDAGVCHRDLKPENILLSDSSKGATLKLCDFGLSCICEKKQKMKTVCGTHHYLAPEVILKDRGQLDGYDFGVDMWGVGLLLFLLMFGYNPFRKSDVAKTHNAIVHCQYSFPEQAFASPQLQHLISQLLVPHNRRLNVHQCLAHPWFTENCEVSIIDGERRNTKKLLQDFITEMALSKMLKGIAHRRVEEGKLTMHRSASQDFSKRATHMRRSNRSKSQEFKLSTGIHSGIQVAC